MELLNTINNMYGLHPDILPTAINPYPKPLPPLHLLRTYANVQQDTPNAFDSSHTGTLLDRSYEAFKAELAAQYNQLVDGGLTAIAFTGNSEPYQTSKEMRRRVAATNEFIFYPTLTGYGEHGANNALYHPLLESSGLKAVDDSSNPYDLLYNDLFRVVHDMVAHYPNHANGFSFKGEYNAFLCHAATLPKLAWIALACETIYQTSFYEVGRHLERKDGSMPVYGDSDWLPRSHDTRKYADQKYFYHRDSYATILELIA